MKIGTGKKVVVAMSGGVDSSATAALLKEDGYEIVGCFMRLGSDDSVEAAEGYDNLRDCDPASSASAGNIKLGHQGCCSLNDASDARLVAAMLDVPFYVLNFKKDFGRVIDYFVSEYNAGRTPNPCVRCNDWLKFGKMAAYAKSIDADFIASGHYARIEHTAHQSRLLRGRDLSKDQSYVLFGVAYDQLRHMLLPVGGYEKHEVRQIAEQHNLPVFNKPDSQEICFVPDNDYARLVTRRTPELVRPGDIVDGEGSVLGQHEGHQHFTLGQRRGLSISLGHPIYVTDIDAQTNTITVGEKQDTYSAALRANQTNWLVDADAHARPCLVKIRYNHQPVPAVVRGIGADTFEVQFDEPQSAVTPGQAVVCYDDDHVLGGGWISEAVR